MTFSLSGKKFLVILLQQGLDMAKKLTAAQKRKLFSYLVERDGFSCLYCKKEFKNVREPIIEHLNGDDTDGREDNLTLSHQSCNIKKAKNDKDYLNIAEEKLIENESHLYVGESFLEEKSKGEASTEIEISNKCYSITEKYLTDNILNYGWIDYKETLHSIVYLCREQVKHGSDQQIRSHIQALTSPIAPFDIVNDPKTKKKIIKRRFTQTSSIA